MHSNQITFNWLLYNTVMNAKALSITEHNMKTMCSEEVAQWTKRLLAMDEREFKSRRRIFLILQHWKKYNNISLYN